MTLSRYNYDPDWQDGDWQTNCDEDIYLPVYVQGKTITRYGSSRSAEKGNYRMGPPEGQPTVSAAALEKSGMIGVYRLPDIGNLDRLGDEKIAIDDADTKQQRMARLIKLGTYSGIGWELEYDERRAREYVTEEYVAVMGAIAAHIVDGRTEGISPFWKLHLNG